MIVMECKQFVYMIGENFPSYVKFTYGIYIVFDPHLT